MKTAALVVTVLTLVGAACANTIDPGIIIGGGSGSFHVTGTPFFFGQGTGSDCVFVGPGFGGPNPGPCVFANDTGFAWNTLTIFVTSASSLSLGCGIGATPFFSGCTSATVSPGFYRFDFFGGTGWPINGDEMINIFGFGRWPDGATFQGVPNIPEPATMLLTVTGLASLYLRRRLRKS